jgi:hypothetical protein
MKHNFFVIIFVVILGIIAVLAFGRLFGKYGSLKKTESPQVAKEDVKETCPGILVSVPRAGSKIGFPFGVSGVIHPVREHSSGWVVFEGQAGYVVVRDGEGNILSDLVPLKLTVDWMNIDPKPFSVTIPQLHSEPVGSKVELQFIDDNPSGENIHTCTVPIVI